jgi:tRNA (guanine37-N1)-methyltransferase
VVWGDAIDEITSNQQVIDLIILTPAGKKFNQQMAAQFSKCDQIIFACGRYEGIDARVGDYYRTQKNFRVHSLKEESHSISGQDDQQLVEYPNYTKPALWRGLEVPEVLLSGNHGEIAKWRRSEAERRTRNLERE